MTEENAAQVEEVVEDERLDQPEIESEPETQEAESAPAEDVKNEEQDAIQQRINKEVSRRYQEKRRADELQKKLDELTSKPKPAEKVPTLEDFDHDEDAFNAANIKYQVAEAVRAEAEKLRQDQVAESAVKAQEAFNERIVAFNKPDFAEKANSVPELPPGVADALVQSDNGPELIYHLGTHLDLADKLSSMTPNGAMMELGRISAVLAAKPEPKVSTAPDPIEPLNSGGSISNERGPKGATFE